MSDRFEVLPFARAEDEAAKLPEHVRLTVTCSPTHGLDRTIETATRLRLLGHAVTVHLAARMSSTATTSTASWRRCRTGGSTTPS